MQQTSPTPSKRAAAHPIDVLEDLARLHDWTCERTSQDDMNLSMVGQYGDYQLAANWRKDLHCLHLACMVGLKTPPQRRGAMCELLARINSQLWLGHFDIWENEGTLLYRNVLLLGTSKVRAEQCQALVRDAFARCEQFLPAFQYLIWADYTTRQALDACLFETQGDA